MGNSTSVGRLYAGPGLLVQLQINYAQSKQACNTLRPSSSLLTSVTNVIILCPVLLIRNWSQTFISGFIPSLVLTRSSRFMVYHRFAYKLQRASCASLGRVKQDAEGSSSPAAVVPISATGPQPGEASSKLQSGDCAQRVCTLAFSLRTSRTGRFQDYADLGLNVCSALDCNGLNITGRLR